MYKNNLKIVHSQIRTCAAKCIINYVKHAEPAHEIVIILLQFWAMKDSI